MSASGRDASAAADLAKTELVLDLTDETLASFSGPAAVVRKDGSIVAENEPGKRLAELIRSRAVPELWRFVEQALVARGVRSATLRIETEDTPVFLDVTVLPQVDGARAGARPRPLS